MAGFYGYAALFLIIFFESFPPTFFLPGDSLLFTTGFLASQGVLNFPLLIAIFFLAAVGGYIFSYKMGQKIRPMFFSKDDFPENRKWFKREHLEKTERFYDKYGSKTLIIGRFVPIVRSFAPTLAGAVEMNFRKFLKYVVIGGVFWTGGVTSVGFFLGHLIPSADFYLTPIILGIIAVSLLPTVIEYIKNRKTK
jgi:membrane-associated protein